MAAHLSRRQRLLAAHLTATAGFVDGLAFIHLGGYFVSFMSGNSTRAGADLAEGDPLGWALAMGLVGFFVLGVMASALAYRWLGLDALWAAVVLLLVPALGLELTRARRADPGPAADLG